MPPRRWFLLILLPCAIAMPSPVGAEPEDPPHAALEARRRLDPLDAEALLGLARIHEDAGRTGFARRYLRAFLRLVPMHPRRIEAARRIQTLLPAHPWLPEAGGAGTGRPQVLRHALDGRLAAYIPEGPYWRRLRIEHPSDADVTVQVEFPVHLGAYVLDLHQTPRTAWAWFLLESGGSVPAWWGADGRVFQQTLRDEAHLDWTWVGGTFRAPNHPAWPLSWHEARALARASGRRLPTEAEWEKAARGGLHLDAEERRANPQPGRRHPWGDAPAEGVGGARANAVGEDDDGGSSDDDRSIPVDALPDSASPYGCIQMLGNVQSWCADWFLPDEAVFRLPARNPVAQVADPSGAGPRSKVTKGGYFNWSLHNLSIDARTCHTHDVWAMALLFKCGLRAAAVAPPVDEEGWDPFEDPALALPSPDPLDGAWYLGQARDLASEAPERAWRHARAAARLLRQGPLRPRALELVRRLRPQDLWEPVSEGRRRNRMDGGVAARVGELWVDRHEVTEGQVLTFLAETAVDPSSVLGINRMRYGNGDLPAATLTHREALAYATWAGKRLPTRAEWLQVAGVGSRPWPWGDAAPQGRASSSVSPQPGRGNAWDRRRPVGQLVNGATPEGVLDLVGNVAEWCMDGPVEDESVRWLLGGDMRGLEVETLDDWAWACRHEAMPEEGIHGSHAAGLRGVSDD